MMSGKRAGRLLLAGVAVLLGIGGSARIGWVGAWQERGEVTFARDIEPILRARCVGCHNGRTASGGLRLDNEEFIGREAIVLPGRAEQSQLYRRLVAKDEERMPPVGDGLTEREIGLIRSWIDGMRGGGEGGHWAWRSIVRPEVPASGHPIDAFVRARLAREGWGSSPEADRRTLIRRLSFDLTGLPPTPERVRQFIEDRRPDAWERLVDELLASPRYGERWARHWLDVVHYGDTHGYDKDKPRPQAWPYRDYVIRALNEDKPYARFVGEQIAGDALYPGTRDGYEALGFIAAGPWDFIGHAELPESKIDGKIARHLDRDDMVANTIGTFASVTVHCAQCHNHKFDPIPQSDYYSLQAVFAALDRAEMKFIPGDAAATRELNRLEGRQRQLAERRRVLERDAARAAGAPVAEIDGLIAKAGTEAEKDGLRARRVELVVAAMSAEQRAEREALVRELTEMTGRLAGFPKAEVVYAGMVYQGAGQNFVGTGGNGGRPREIRILARGQVTTPGAEVGPGALSLLGGLPARFGIPAGAPESERRVALAGWLTDQRNPLTWRSIVNRVWQYHFGAGLVATPNDFGRNGARPTHPELLDWLAAEFRDSGGSLKRLHRLIVTSATYRQSSSPGEVRGNPRERDSGNTLLWRQNRRKLEAEAIRDTILAVSGTLDETMGGPGWQDFVVERPEHSPHYRYDLADPGDRRTWRRSIYRFIVRSQTQPWMSALDCADPSMRVDRRNESLSPVQALALLNNGFVLTQARQLAARLEREAPGDPRRQVDLAFRLAFGRDPLAGEREQSAGFIIQYGLTSFCRAVFNLNEFAFVD